MLMRRSVSFGDGIGTNWHQDNAYFKIRDPMRGTAMWIAAHDATIANGTITPVAADGTVCVATYAAAHLVVDVTGVFT